MADTDNEYLQVGQRLIELGYDITPIRSGLKHPGYANWHEDQVTLERLPEFTRDPSYAGWGIKNRSALGIDADIYDNAIAEEMAKVMPPGAPVRVGNFPKLMYLVKNPGWSKRASKAYVDKGGNVNKVELLANGQQSVVYGIHPETGKPYYFHGISLMDIPAAELPGITEDDVERIFSRFEELAANKVASGEWQAKFDRTSGGADVVKVSEFENLVRAQRPLDMTREQVIEVLKQLDPNCDRDTWVNIGAALHHQFQGSAEGLELFDGWSCHADNYEGWDDCEARWKSYRLDGSRAPTTMASLIARVKTTRATAQLPTLGDWDLDPCFDFKAMVTRQFIVGKRLLAGFISVTVSPGGVSKSMFSLLTAVSIATGRDLTGEGVHKQGRVCIVNNEDDKTEVYRRLRAISDHYDIPWDEIAENVKVLSGYHTKYVFAYKDEYGTIKPTPFTEQLIERLKGHGVVHLIIDPAVSIHNLNENDNVEIDAVVSILKRVASETGVSIELIHHTRKGGGNSEGHAGDAEASRGASALINAARIATTLARMSRETALERGLDWSSLGNRLVRVDDAKMNYALADAEARWYRLVTVQLPNGDTVGIHERFDLEAVEHDAEGERESHIREQFLQLLHIGIGRGRDFSQSPNSPARYAPRAFVQMARRMPDMISYSVTEYERALEYLLDAGRLTTENHQRRVDLVPVDS